MITSRCGILCEECEYQEKVGCKSCTNISMPFWGKPCEVKTCCEEKGLEYCGVCADFPCELLNSFSYDKEHGDNGKRIEQCKVWSQNRT